MKRIIKLGILGIILLLIMTTTLYAATPTFSIQLVADKTTVARGEEITVTLKAKEFANMTEGLYAFFAEIEYDKNYFEELTTSDVSGKGTWSSVPTFNPNSNQITADSGTGVKIDSEVFSIKLKVKANAVEGGTTTIKVKNFQASEGDVDINANQDAIINIKIEKNTGNNNGDTEDNNGSDNNGNTEDNNGSDNNGNTEDNNGSDNNGNTEDNNGSNNNGNTEDNNGSDNNGNTEENNGSNNNGNTGNNNPSDNNSEDKTISDTKLPQTGEKNYIVVIAISLIAVSLFMYMKYRKYKGIE